MVFTSWFIPCPETILLFGCKAVPASHRQAGDIKHYWDWWELSANHASKNAALTTCASSLWWWHLGVCWVSVHWMLQDLVRERSSCGGTWSCYRVPLQKSLQASLCIILPGPEQNTVGPQGQKLKHEATLENKNRCPPPTYCEEETDSSLAAKLLHLYALA